MKKVWDNTIIGINWVFALCLAGIIVTAGANGTAAYAHTLFSSILLVAVALRIFYGFAGTQTARFSNMLSPASDVILHLDDMVNFKPQSWVGHSPIGGLFAFLALLGLGFTAMTGLLAVNGEGYGSWFSSWVNDNSIWHTYALHAVATTITLVLWSIYALGVVINLFSNRDSLATYISSGRKSVILRYNLNDEELTTQPRGAAWSSFVLSTVLTLALLVPFVYQTTAPGISTVEYVELDINDDAQSLSQIETAAGQATDFRPVDTPEDVIGNTNVRYLAPTQETQNSLATPSGFEGLSIDIPVQKQ